MFMGRYEHNIDEKGRLTIPARFRELLVNGAYVTQGFDRNLLVLTASSFDQISQRVNQLSMTNSDARQLKRLLFSNAEHCDLDRAGRMLLPQFLRDIAGINGEAVLVGAGNYFEIWSPALWAAQLEKLQDAEANALRFAELDLTFG